MYILAQAARILIHAICYSVYIYTCTYVLFGGVEAKRPHEVWYLLYRNSSRHLPLATSLDTLTGERERESINTQPHNV